MRVVHLIDHMGAGGAQRVVLDLVEARDPALEAAVLSLRDACLPDARVRLEAAGASYLGIGLSARAPLALRRLRSSLAQLAPDVLHTHLEFSDTVGVLAALSLGRTRPRVVSHVHNDPAHQYRLAHRLAGRLLAGRTDAHIVASPSLAEAVRSAFANRPRRLEVIPYGIHPRGFDRPRDEQGAALRQGAKRVVGTIGRLARQKATHRLLRATPRLLEAEPSTRVLIVGDGPLRRQLEAESRALGVAEAVDFLGYQSDLSTVYAALDVFVLPSRYEGVPLALLEAMALGVPCVASRVAGIREVVEDGATGLLVDSADPAALAAAILRLFSDAGLRGALCDNARRLVLRDYTRERMVARIEALYRELVRQRSAAPARS